MRPLSLLLLLGLLLSSSCRKWTYDAANEEQPGPLPAFTNDMVASQFMLGVYEELMKDYGLLNGQISRLCALYSGEFAWRGLTKEVSEFAQMNVLSQNRLLTTLWTPGYDCIRRCNNVIERLRNEHRVSADLRHCLTGEALLLRAACYFYLVNLFDRIPFIKGLTKEADGPLEQESPEIVYEHIFADLEQAIQLLPVVHPQATADSLRYTRPTQGSALALLARVCLYRQRYEQAARYASLVIESKRHRLEDSLPLSFRNSSTEVLFQLKPASNAFLTGEGSQFLREMNGRPIYQLGSCVLDAFGDNDQRQRDWTKKAGQGAATPSWYYKYRIAGKEPRQEYNQVLRLGEQFLIRAEARARLGDLTGALADLGTLRQRARLPPPAAGITRDSLLLLIARERRAELFCEWGHHFLDLKRWSQLVAGDVLQTYALEQFAQRPDWQTHKLRFPIPQLELDVNPRFTQNSGY